MASGGDDKFYLYKMWKTPNDESKTPQNEKIRDTYAYMKGLEVPCRPPMFGNSSYLELCPTRPVRVTNQLKYFRETVYEAVNEHPCAWFFTMSIEKYFPDYRTKIRYPMDLGIIRQRLEYRYYLSGSECFQDFELLFQNCFMYFPPYHVHHDMGRQLEQAFMTALADIPRDEVVVSPESLRFGPYSGTSSADLKHMQAIHKFLLSKEKQV